MKNREVQSSTGGPRSQPDPPPEHPISARLEQVRKSLPGDVDRKAFHRQVAQKGNEIGMSEDDIPSYSSARLYHYDRVPSVHYLALVSQTFDYRLEWLISGEEPPTKAEWAARVAEEGAEAGVDPETLEGFSDGLDAPFEDMTPGARAALLRTWEAAQHARQIKSYSLTYGSPAKGRARLVAEAVRAPLESLGVPLPSARLGPSADAVERFTISVSIALTHLFDSLPDPFEEETDGQE